MGYNTVIRDDTDMQGDITMTDTNFTIGMSDMELIAAEYRKTHDKASDTWQITADYWKTHVKASSVAKYHFNQKQVREKKIAVICGLVFVACVLTIVIAETFFPVRTVDAGRSYAVVNGEYFELNLEQS